MNKTLLLIKPDAVRNCHIGSIISIVENSGFTILDLKMFTFTYDLARQFYKIHVNKEFFPILLEFITSGPCVAVYLKRDHAVKKLRELIGATDPLEADAGTIRKLYAENKTRNAVHASDSPENALVEITLIFGSSRCKSMET